MENTRFIRTLGLFLVLGLTGLSDGCGPTALSPTDQEKVDAGIKKDRVARHKELNEDLKAGKQVQGKQAAGRKAAHQGPG
jgi:hypothetical protein